MPNQATHRKLYEFLRECELENRHFTLDAVASATALSEVSVRTYVSQKLSGRCVERIDAQHFAARGIARMPWVDFQGLMSQKAPVLRQNRMPVVLTPVREADLGRGNTKKPAGAS